MKEVRIDVRGVGKRFRLFHGGVRSLKAWALDFLKRDRSREFWALRDVKFSVNAGETLGIIGANGAGKSTLLSLVAGTILPTEGSIRVQGKVSSLLELGAGFHPELTGAENVFLYGAIMGIPREQMKKRFDAIVQFAELSEFIDQPVKHYSSGMYVRLGFAVAVEVDPDVLIIDEVLAVGDQSFQRKCIGKLNEFKSAGKTMLIVSHDLGTILRMSDRILLLDEGKVTGLGDPDSVVQSYKQQVSRKNVSGLEREWGSGELKINEVELRDSAGAETDCIQSGQDLTVCMRYEAMERIEKPVFGISLADSGGNVIFGSNTQIEGVAIPCVEGKGNVVVDIKDLSLASGTYYISVSAHSWDHQRNYHRLDNFFVVRCESSKDTAGSCYFSNTWRIGGEAE